MKFLAYFITFVSLLTMAQNIQAAESFSLTCAVYPAEGDGEASFGALEMDPLNRRFSYGGQVFQVSNLRSSTLPDDSGYILVWELYWPGTSDIVKAVMGVYPDSLTISWADINDNAWGHGKCS